MGIYTERKIGKWSGAAILAAAFAVLYGIWLANDKQNDHRSQPISELT